LITDAEVILQTETWIKKVVIDCHFCPFAAAPVKQQSVRYVVGNQLDLQHVLEMVLAECVFLDEHDATETTFIILPDSFPDFMKYLDVVADAEDAMAAAGYEGIYQLAGFHPLYLFAGSDEQDAANYTNRSIFPMLHLLREASIDKALENYATPEKIPENNIDFARKKGLVYMKMLRDSVMTK